MNNNGMGSAVPAGEGGTVPTGEGQEKKPATAKPISSAPPGEPEPEISEGDKTDPDMLYPLEKILYEKYGMVGVKIYNLIDVEKTAEEILRATGVSEARLVEILEFMDEQGIIKLEKPETAEEAEEEKNEEEEAEKEVTLVDVPMMEKLSLSNQAVLLAELAVKFGPTARQLVNLVDGKRDFVELALATGLSFFEVDGVMAYFGKKGFVSFSQLSRDDIKKKYGEDGFAIYKRYGREGLLLYEMIGKEASLRDIISKSRLEPDHAVEIFLFIHKVLGLDLPLDRDEIYRQIGMRKPSIS